MKLIFEKFSELSMIDKNQKFDLVRPSYGRNLEDFTVGQVYVHPRGLTITKALALEFATSFHEANPLYLNASYAKACGYEDVLLSPLLLLNIALSLGVQNDSEKAMANLGYYDVFFPKAVYPETTLRAFTQILDVKNRGGDKPGIVTFRTVAVDEKNERVVCYDRKIMVSPAGKKSEPTTNIIDVLPGENPVSVWEIPDSFKAPRDLTGIKTYFENFSVGQVFLHPNGRTVTDEHFSWTYRVMNTHPLHFDRLYAKGLDGKMSGEPIVYGGLVFAWLCGLASRDVGENALWDLGYTEGYHTQPTVSGDTLTAMSRVAKVTDLNDQAGIVEFQLVGFKNLKSTEAFEKYGAEIFIFENAKKDLGLMKIPEKVFEIRRKLLIRKK